MLQVNVLITEMQDGTLAAKISREVGPLLAEGRELRDSGKVPTDTARPLALASSAVNPTVPISGNV